MRGIILIPLFCLLVGMFLLTFQVSKATTSEPSIVQVTPQQQIHLIMTALTEAINDPSNFNLDMVSVAFPAEQWESVKEKIRHVMSAYRADSSLVCRLTFKPHAIVEFKDGGYGSMVEALVEFGNMVRNKTIEVNFQPGKHCPIITNLDEVLDEVEPFLEESVREMGPYASEKPVMKSASATTPFLSNNLLLPNYIGFGSYKRFTSSVSHTEYGYDILSGPYGLFCMVYRDQQMPQLDREFLIVADRNDNRITATTKNLNDPGQPYWFQQIGPFYHPMAVAQMGQNWYVSEDTVVHVYWSDWNGNWSHTDYLVGGFKNIVDVDAARIPTGGNDIWEVSVLDRVNKTIKVFDYYGVLQRTLSTYCSDPTALCYARNGITGYKNNYLYVLDNDGNRIVRIDSWGIAVPIISDPGLFPSDAQLTSAATDAYATLYILDRNNSVCHVFGGMEPIATFGTGPGTADNQLYYPRRLRIAEGWKYYTGPDSVGPLHLGDGFLSELYTSNTGLRRFVLGCDVVEDTMIYFPQYQPGYGDRVGVYWRISNTAETWREVWADGVQLDYQHDPINVPGSHNHVYWLDEFDPDSTWYKFTIRARSIYGTTDTTFVDSIYVERYVDPGPRFVFDWPDIFDPSGEFPRWCFHEDPDRWWGLSISGEDRHQDSTLLLYTWSNYSGIKLYTDTIIGHYASYLLHESGDTVWFKFMYYPSGHPEGGYAYIFTTRYSTDPYDSTKPEYYNYNWYPDTILTLEQLFSHACKTSCTPPCPPPDPGGCPMLYVWDGNQYMFVDNILPQSEGMSLSANVTDLLPIHGVYESEYNLRIIENENEISYFDRLAVWAVDIPEGIDVVFTNEGQPRVLTGSATSPVNAVTNLGDDITDLLQDDDDLKFRAAGWGYIDLEYQVGEDSIYLLAPRPPPKPHYKPTVPGNEPNIITIRAENETGEYVVIQKIYPRMNGEEIGLVELDDYVSQDGILRLRVEWTVEMMLDYLPYVTYEEVDFFLSTATLTSATHSIKDDVTSHLELVDDAHVVLRPGEQIDLTFDAEPPADGMTRVLLFEVTGRYETMTDLADGNLMPVDFEFPQNYPNPFNPTTTFSFSLPKAEHVKLEIFNILGQKIATVVDGDYEAGDHKVEWDGSTHASGVYLYRLEAGEFTESKKMLLLK